MYKIQIGGTEHEIDSLSDRPDREIKKIKIILTDRNFEIGRVRSLLNAAIEENSLTTTLCKEIYQAILDGCFSFNLIRKISGWLKTGKKGGDSFSNIMKLMFYGTDLQRFSEYENRTVVPNFKEIFISWLTEVFRKQSEEISKNLMIINGREITPEIFKLDDSKLNRQGLFEFAMDVAEQIGIHAAFVIKTDETEYLESWFEPNSQVMYFPEWQIDEKLALNQFRGTRGAVLHEAAHAIFPDWTYILRKDETDEELLLMHEIANVIDDIKVEEKMIKHFSVDKTDFSQTLLNMFSRLSSEEVEDFFQNGINLLHFLICVYFRNLDPNVFKGRAISSSVIEKFETEIIPVIDRFLISDGTARDSAFEIIDIIRGG